MFLSLLLFTACGPKKTAVSIPEGKWYQAENWSIACYNPPNYGVASTIQRQNLHNEALNAMFEQWKEGGRPDGLSISVNLMDDLENAFLGDLSKVENVSRENFAKCKQVASGSLSKGDWKAWVLKLKVSLNKTECTKFLGKVLDPDLDIDTDWQPREGYPICKDDKIKIKASDDQYRISEGGPWITVAGDKNTPTVGGDLPCKTEGCYAGQLLLRFVNSQGQETIIPVGVSKTWTAPAHGTIYYGINDTSLYDNKWYESSGVIYRAAVTIDPVN